MDDGLGSLQQGSQLASGQSAMSIGGTKQQDEQASRPQYSMPGILHFLQTEWARFEMERAQWEIERAELQVNMVNLVIFPFHVISKVRPINLHRSRPNMCNLR